MKFKKRKGLLMIAGVVMGRLCTGRQVGRSRRAMSRTRTRGRPSEASGRPPPGTPRRSRHEKQGKALGPSRKAAAAVLLRELLAQGSTGCA
jgi:hypothetical protein